MIDPHFYRSDGSNFLIWKTDDNAVGGESAIYIQELQVIKLHGDKMHHIQEDGLAFQENTEPKMILKADLPEVSTSSNSITLLTGERSCRGPLAPTLVQILLPPLLDWWRIC